MLIRKVALSPEARMFFRIEGDPLGVPTTRAQVFLCPTLRVAYEHMLNKARYGGMMAITGESGSGKSTLKDLLIEDLEASGERVTIIEPVIIGMEASDKRGRTLRATDIGDAVLRAVAPLEKLKAKNSARLAQVQDVLAAACAADPSARHLMILEEAHRLPLPTLRHLKNFIEMKKGLRRFLSIVLIGQPELSQRLSPVDMSIREVWQRCEVVRLEPLDKHLGDYLRHRLGAHSAAGSAWTPSAIDRLSQVLTDPVSKASFIYPLAVDNWAAAALNLAARIGIKALTAEQIDEVRNDIRAELAAIRGEAR